MYLVYVDDNNNLQLKAGCLITINSAMLILQEKKIRKNDEDGALDKRD